MFNASHPSVPPVNVRTGKLKAQRIRCRTVSLMLGMNMMMERHIAVMRSSDILR